MPRLVNSSLKFKGKIDDKVYVDSRRYGYHVRKAPEPGARKSDWALKLQHGRNKNLNGLASSIRLVINNAYHELYRSDLYHTILGLIKREPSDSRCFSLLRLKGMEINRNYKLLGDYKVTVTPKRGKIIVNLDVKRPPISFIVKTNCYYFDMVLFTWDSTNRPVMVARETCEWTYIKADLPEFEFDFHKPKGAIHWMVALRMQLGIDCIDDHPNMVTVKAQGAQFLDMGSFNKKEQELLDKRWEEIKDKKKYSTPGIPKPVITHRVKAKKRGGGAVK